MSALNHAPKLFYTVVLSAFLVACGGGGSGDDTGTTVGASTADAGTATGDGGLGDLDLGGDDSAATTDGAIEPFEPLAPDADGDGISDEDELKVCKGQGGSDEDSSNEAWNDNCWLRADIIPATAELDESPFYFSTYAKGIQRVLYCQGHAGVVDSNDAFSDGYYGPDTAEAVRKFQKAQGLVEDGIVGERTWAKLQEQVETEDRSEGTHFIQSASDLDYHVFGVLGPAAENPEIDCRQEINFFGRLQIQTDLANGDRYAGWELAKNAGVNDRGSFSINAPQ